MAKRFGVMFDCSRNAVMRPEKVKEYATLLRKMGYNMLMLYTEDTYEIPEENYFGYLRGRYSQQDLISISEYCHSIGMEVIPAIQTLAHINTIFKWGAFSPMCDIDDILLADNEATYDLIRRMIASCRKAYPYAKVINIGMDEAKRLGLGKYLTRNGYVQALDIFLRHLDRVVRIAREYDFEPIMWSDMFFRIEHGGEYESIKTAEQARLSEKAVSLCPKEVSPVFWRYHSTDVEVYCNMLREHKRFAGETWFAGGAFTWFGFVGNNASTLKCMLPAMDACAKEDTQNIVITMWGDNGKETSFFSMLPSLFAIAKYHDGERDMKMIKQEFFELIGERFDDMMLLDLPGDYGKVKVHNTSYHKYMLYNDAFFGFLDPLIEPASKESYALLAPQLEQLAQKGGKYAYLYENMARYSRLMMLKCDLGIRTREAYAKGSPELLAELAEDYRKTAENAEAFAESMRVLWYCENRTNGFEVHEHRLGGLAFRLRSLATRLEAYLKGEITSIPELEEDILPYWGAGKPYEKGDFLPEVSTWSRIVTVNRM